MEETTHDRVTSDVGSNTVFGDDRGYNASRQTGTGVGTGMGTSTLGDDREYGSSRTTGMSGTGYGDDQTYGSSRTTGARYGDDTTGYGSSRTTGVSGAGYGDDQTYGTSRTTGTGIGTGTGTGGLSYNDQAYDSSTTSKGRSALGGSGIGNDDAIRSSGSGYDNTTSTTRSGIGGGRGVVGDDSTYGTSTGDRTGSSTTAPLGSHDNFRSDSDAREGHTLLSEYPAREELPHQSEMSSTLASTPGPFQVPTTDDPKGASTSVTSSVSSQNAPGAAGRVGEGVMGALGVGGTHVERPKEEQGLGEKIVNLLGG